MYQIPIKLYVNEKKHSFDNYYSAENGEIIRELKGFVNNQSIHTIFLQGASGHGKTHLLHALCSDVDKEKTNPIFIPLKEFSQYSPNEVIQDIESYHLVCIDDIEQIAGNLIWEKALFQTLCDIKNNDKHILISSSVSPKETQIQLSDLQSRLHWGIHFNIKSADGEHLMKLLQAITHRKRFYMPDNVAKHIITHCNREMNNLLSIVNLLEKETLARQRKLTIPFCREIFMEYQCYESKKTLLL